MKKKGDGAMKKKSVLCYIAAVLVIIGALNWGIVGAFNYNVVEAIFGAGSVLTRIVYIFVGLGGLYAINSFVKCTHTCKD